ncbi:MAG: hypothetical protein ACK5X0_06565 [Rhodospirillales bacterium]
MPANRSSPLACFYSATLAWNQTAVDSAHSSRNGGNRIEMFKPCHNGTDIGGGKRHAVQPFENPTEGADCGDANNLLYAESSGATSGGEGSSLRTPTSSGNALKFADPRRSGGGFGSGKFCGP